MIAKTCPGGTKRIGGRCIQTGSKSKSYEGKRFTHVGNISQAMDKKSKGKRLRNEKAYWNKEDFYVRSAFKELKHDGKSLGYYEIYVRSKNLPMP